MPMSFGVDDAAGEKILENTQREEDNKFDMSSQPL